jgi:hypothetical protein
MHGKLLRTTTIVSDLTRIPMSGLGSAAYILRVTRNQQELKSFKIIKK